MVIDADVALYERPDTWIRSGGGLGTLGGAPDGPALPARFASEKEDYKVTRR